MNFQFLYSRWLVWASLLSYQANLCLFLALVLRSRYIRRNENCAFH